MNRAQFSRILSDLRPHIMWDGIKEIILIVGRSQPLRVAAATLVPRPVAFLMIVVAIFALIRWIAMRPPENIPSDSESNFENSLILEPECINISQGNLQLWVLRVTNQMSRFENTIHNVRARVTFTSALGERLTTERAQFLAVDLEGHFFCSDSVALEMLESRDFVLIASSAGRFYAPPAWPVVSETNNRLRLGEWEVEISIRSDNEKDHVEAHLVLNLHRDGSCSWHSREDKAPGRSGHVHASFRKPTGPKKR
jgi:hypothetical protein